VTPANDDNAVDVAVGIDGDEKLLLQVRKHSHAAAKAFQDVIQQARSSHYELR